MQIIETSAFAVRSALLRLEGGPEAPSFTLFPMVHVAEQGFYDEVTRRLEKHDLVLYEGAQLKSWSAWLITYCYESLSKSPRLGLVMQHTMRLAHLRDRLVHADVSGDEFEKRWSKLGWKSRAAIIVTAPIARLYFRYFATRQVMAGYLRLNLLKSRDEILCAADEEAIDEVLVTWRDQHLIEVIDKHLQSHRGSPLSIAIVFGAAHMRAVIHHLTRRPEPGYRVAGGEWITVFAF
jgi:hypothetical protein